MTSVLGSVVEFLAQLGFYDVILPFLLVFVVVFAVLEKTMVLGDEKGAPKSNLNSVTAFAFGMMFIAASKLVSALNVALPIIVIMIFVFLSIMLLIGMFYKQGEFDFVDMMGGKEKMIPYLIVAIIGVVLAFLQAFKILPVIVNWVVENYNSTVVASIVFGAVMFFLLRAIVSDKGSSDSSD